MRPATLTRRVSPPRNISPLPGSAYHVLHANSLPGHGLYPKGLTREQIEQYVKEHPGKKEELYSPYTVIERRGNDLIGRPYHEVYRSFVDPMVKALRAAAALSDDKQFAEFLSKRADAFLTDDYYKSDLSWLDLKDPKYDVIFAPYETYLDDVLGVKTSYGAAVLVRNEAESNKLAVYQQYVPDIQDALPLAAEDRPSKRGKATPMEVMDAPYRAGDLRHGYQAVADNLPNDPRIHEQKGSKKIFFKNFMSQEKAITRDATGRYGIDYARIPAALAQLAKELLEIEATGDRARAENWFKRYDAMPPELKSALETTKDVPVDVDPQFAFPERPQ